MNVRNGNLKVNMYVNIELQIKYYPSIIRRRKRNITIPTNFDSCIGGRESKSLSKINVNPC